MSWVRKGLLAGVVAKLALGIWLFAHYVGVPVPWGAVRQRDGAALLAFEHERLQALAAAGEHVPAVLAFDGHALTTGDIGATLEVQKRMPGGWMIGAWATLTDVPFEVFGEGSFDKGLIFRIPFDLYSTKNTRGAYRTIIRPINRDGGRMLDNWPGSLWESMRDTMADRLRRNQDRMIPE